MNRCHLVGVAGVGMSALAQALVGRGYAVSGSDRFVDEGRDLQILDKLKKNGVRLLPQDGSGITDAATEVIVSTAIEEDNPDLVRARALNCPILHRAERLARLVEGRRCIAVTGTSGKTTVTGMLGWILEGLGEDPTVVNGGVVLNWETDEVVGNVRLGSAPLWVVESDESDRSLLHFRPDWAVVTNVSKDHFEVDELTALFGDFARGAQRGVVCGEGVRDLLGGGGAGWVEEAFHPVEERGVYRFDYRGIRFESPLIGRHNAENAFAAVVLCGQLGLDLSRVREVLLAFQGIQRRLQRVGACRDIQVIDDYAHNPAKIAAAWRAVAPSARRVLGVWRPHGFGPLAAMKDELADAFATVCRPDDRLYILPVYYAGGTAARAVTSADLVRVLAEKGVRAELAEGYDALAAGLAAAAAPGDAILCMGARDPELPLFARTVVRELET